MCESERNITIVFLVLVLVWGVELDFVLATNNGEAIRCMETEREALLKFKEGLIDQNGTLSSWGREKECCKWDGVHCNDTTGHVIGIKPVGRYYPYLRGEINSALLKLHYLNVLDLSCNDFGGNKLPEFIWSMSQLQHLNLFWSNSTGTLSPHVGNLTNLRTLDLSDNQFSGTLPSELENLINLENLHLWGNQFSGTLPSEIGNITSLQSLDLSSNHFSGNLPSEIGNITNLETLHLSNNNFYGTIPSKLWSLRNLKDLDLSENDLTSSTADTLLNMSTNHVAQSLRTLNLDSNKLKRLPSSIWRLSMLEELKVSFNSLEDTISDADLAKLPNLKTLYLSFNSLTLDINPNWTLPFQLKEIGLSGCKLGPHFPLWFRTHNSFWTIDISNNGISAEVPKWFWSLCHDVGYLNLSHNHLSGTISDFSPRNTIDFSFNMFSHHFNFPLDRKNSDFSIEYIDFSSNNFSGPIPLLSPSTQIFQMSQNMFSGPLSIKCSVGYQLNVLDLSNNQLTGKLPNCWENMTHLWVLNLANNNFSGEIPHTLGSLFSLQSLHLANNKFSGELPSTLKNCTILELIDIGDNMIAGSIPTWIGEYDEWIAYLILRNNRLHGSIPPQICHLSHIQVLDLSGNNISGNIPPCFNNFTYLVDENIPTYGFFMSFGFSDHDAEITDYATVLWKRMESEYRRNLNLLKLIDLSRNRLDGDIPSSFSSLKALHSLNLSRNRLTGNIDPNIGEMTSLESLDLSSNQLSGEIPNGISQLNFLSVLDLANNNLSGKIPIGTQLQSFPASAYAGNIGLCGSPLPLCSEDRSDSTTNNKAQKDDGGIFSLSFLKEFGISIILGFIFGFWGIVGSLIVKESWRRVFYNFWGDFGDWLYVRVAIVWKMFRRNS